MQQNSFCSEHFTFDSTACSYFGIYAVAPVEWLSQEVAGPLHLRKYITSIIEDITVLVQWAVCEQGPFLLNLDVCFYLDSDQHMEAHWEISVQVF